MIICCPFVISAEIIEGVANLILQLEGDKITLNLFSVGNITNVLGSL
jgi:hypothetical protein